MIFEDGHPDPWSDLMNASVFRRRVQAATAVVAAALIALAGCGPAENPPAPETDTIEQETDTVEHEGAADDEAEHDGDGNPGDDDPAADRNEEEDRTSADDIEGSADPRALVFVHVVEPDEPLTADARWASFNGNNEATAIGMGGAYGMDTTPADRLVADMQTVIDFDFRNAQVDTTQWNFTVQDCPSPLDSEQLSPVRCTATNDETGAEHIAWALPGTFYGQEPGLIVSVELVPAAT